MKRIRKILKSNKGISTGEATISGIGIVFLVMALLVLSVTLFGAYAKIQKVNTMANEIMRIAEIKGHTSVGAETSRIIAASGIPSGEISVSFDCAYISGTSRVQLGGDMSVTVSTQATVGIGNIAQIKIPITGKAVGISEQYWK